MSSLIINEPSLQNLKSRFAYSMVTLVFWVFWIYLWLPVASLIGWLLGFNLFYQEMVVKSGYLSLLDLMGWYAGVILIIGATLLGWASYNLVRFRKKERRKGVDRVDIREIAGRFGVDAETLAAWQRAKRLTVYHNAEGHIERTEP